MSQLNELENLLSELVATPSVNPMLMNASKADSEKDLSNYIYQYLYKKGIKVEFQEVFSDRCNVVAHIPRKGNSDQNVILLCAHMDTYPSSTDESEYTPRIENGIMYGRGTADNKGSLASMLYAFIKAFESENRNETYFVASIDEEHMMTGAKKLSDLGITPDIAITGEPTQLVPIIMQKGIIRSSIRVLGDIGHAAYPKEKNSIIYAGKVISAIESFNSHLIKTHNQNHMLTPESVTPTKVIGNGDMNGTPKETTITFDARFLPDQTYVEFLNKFNIFIKDACNNQFEFSIDEPVFISPANSCSLESQPINRLFECIQLTTGFCDPDVFSYGSEAGYLSRFAKSCLVLGPGDPKYSHKAGECLKLTELKQSSEIFYRLITNENLLLN